MACVKSKLTIIFDNPFWYGVYEREYDYQYAVCKIIFGNEPKDYEVYEYLLKNSNNLLFSKPIECDSLLEKKINPKRKQREIKKEISNSGIGTKAQQALKMQREQIKVQSKTNKKLKKEEAKERKFQLHKNKQKAKHRGH